MDGQGTLQAKTYFIPKLKDDIEHYGLILKSKVQEV